MELVIEQQQEYLISLLSQDIKNAYKNQSELSFRIALSGGGSALHYLPAVANALKSIGVPANLLEIYQVDERFVNLSHIDSNWRMINQLLVAALPDCKIYPMVHNADSAADAANMYDELLKSKIQDEVLFDYVILGMGTDAHIASLFPNSPLLLREDRLVAAHKSDNVQYERITITIPALLKSVRIGLFFTGSLKANVFTEAMKQENNISKPVSFLKKIKNLTVYSDTVIQL